MRAPHKEVGSWISEIGSARPATGNLSRYACQVGFHYRQRRFFITPKCAAQRRFHSAHRAVFMTSDSEFFILLVRAVFTTSATSSSPQNFFSMALCHTAMRRGSHKCSRPDTRQFFFHYCIEITISPAIIPLVIHLFRYIQLHHSSIWTQIVPKTTPPPYRSDARS